MPKNQRLVNNAYDGLIDIPKKEFKNLEYAAEYFKKLADQGNAYTLKQPYYIVAQ